MPSISVIGNQGQLAKAKTSAGKAILITALTAMPIVVTTVTFSVVIKCHYLASIVRAHHPL